MSVQATSWVIKHSPHKGSELLCLIMIADHASPDGTNAYPSIKTLAAECRMSERQVTRIVQRLESSGAISIDRSSGRVANVYTVNMSGLDANNDDKMAGINTDKMSGSRVPTLTIVNSNPDRLTRNPDKLTANPDIAMSDKPIEPITNPTEPSLDVVDAIAEVIVSASFVGDEYEAVKRQVSKSLTRVEGFDPRDGPLQADLYVGYYTTGKGKKRQPSNWYTSWLNWMKQAVKYEQRDNQQDQPRLNGGTAREGGTGSEGAVDPDIERRGYDYDQFVNRPAAVGR